MAKAKRRAVRRDAAADRPARRTRSTIAAVDRRARRTRLGLATVIGAGLTAAAALTAGAARIVADRRSETSRSRAAFFLPVAGGIMTAVAAIAARRQRDPGAPTS